VMERALIISLVMEHGAGPRCNCRAAGAQRKNSVARGGCRPDRSLWFTTVHRSFTRPLAGNHPSLPVRADG
jgi:hypothetical protein